MKSAITASLSSLLVAGTASSAFVGFFTSSIQVSTGGILLDQCRLVARFDGATDTVLNAFNFSYVSSASTHDPYSAFYHKDNSDYNGGVLSRQFGTWAPTLTGSSTLNRPYDSFLTIGGTATPTNTTSSDPSWNSGGSGAHAGSGAGWNRADLLNNGTIGWFNSSPPNLQGRVGVAPNTMTEVLLAQFVTDRNVFAGLWSLTIGYSDGTPTTAPQFATAIFPICLPAPGTLALLGLAELTNRRRRR